MSQINKDAQLHPLDHAMDSALSEKEPGPPLKTPDSNNKKYFQNILLLAEFGIFN